MGLLGKFRKDVEVKEVPEHLRVTNTPLRQLAQRYLTAAQNTDLEADSKKALGGNGILGVMNPMPLLWKLAKSLPDAALESIADNVVKVADEISAIRLDESIERAGLLNGTGSTIQDHTIAEAS